MLKDLKGIKVAFLVDKGFEQVELTDPVKALRNANALVEIISPEKKVTGWNFTNWGDEITADVLLKDAQPEKYDALVLPGGVFNPDFLRQKSEAIDFVKSFFTSNKPIAAICHGPWILVETAMIKGKKLTSFPSIKTDMINAGANWVNEEVVVDSNLITSRKPADLPAFNEKVNEILAAVIKSPEFSSNRPPVKDTDKVAQKSKESVKK